jgi:putative endonuclease
MAWMYILECVDGSYYVGSTNDLERRILEHQEGRGARYTTKRLPVKLVYTEEYNFAAEAFEREKQVQNWSRAKREALINGNREALQLLAKKKFEKKKQSTNSGSRVGRMFFPPVSRPSLTKIILLTRWSRYAFGYSTTRGN